MGMEWFIVREGVEEKAELEDVIPLITDYHMQHIMKYNVIPFISLSRGLAHMSDEIKEIIYRYMSPRTSWELKKEVNITESEYEKDSNYIREERAEIMRFLWKKNWLSDCSEQIVCKETKQKEKIPFKTPSERVEDMKKEIEKACNSGHLQINHFDTEKMTEEDIQKAFTAFNNRRDELRQIRSLNISKKSLSAAALLFEEGMINELEIHGDFDGSWPAFLEKCHTLTSIKISMWKGLTEFPSWLRNAVSLRHLSIRETKITFIPDWIGELQSLTELSLGPYNNNLKTLPDSLGKLVNLVKLEIRLPIEKLPDNIGNLANLVNLELYNSSIEKLPDSIGDLLSLTELSLEGNQNLKTLPDSIGKLKNLVKFNLSGSPIEKLPNGINNLQNLTEFSLRGGDKKLKTLPDDIGSLKNLHKFELGGLSIERIPDWIGDLQNLTELSLSGEFKTLPDSIGKLKNLVKLDLSDSSIEELPDTIVNCTALEYVNICRTYIRSVPCFISSVKTFYQSIELIPDDNAISYRSFCNHYYRLVDVILQFHNKARKEGILALEDDVDLMSDDLFRKGTRWLVDGSDPKTIRGILTPTIEREHDFYRKKLMEVAMEGVLSIHNGCSLNCIIFLLAALVDIENNPLDTACTKYLAGDYEALSNIDLKAAILPEEESEEIRFVRRAIAMSEIVRKEGYLALEKHLDHDGIAKKDIFEYGLLFVIDNWEYEEIDNILTKLIAHKTNPVQKNLALAQKEAVLSLYEDNNPRVIALKLAAYFDKSIEREINRMCEI